jgi:hypothetical protein
MYIRGFIRDCTGETPVIHERTKTMALTLNQFKAMFPDDPIRAGLVDIVQERSVILPLLNFIPVDGFTYRYGENVKLPGIGFRNINGSYTDSEGVINPRDEKLVPLGGSIKTDQWMIDLRGGRARATQIANKIRAAGLFFDKAFIKGDSLTNKQSFDGLQARILTTGAQCISMATNGAALTLAKLDEALDAVNGDNGSKRIICNKTVRRKIRALALAAAGGASLLDVGRQATEYSGAPIVLTEDDQDGTAIMAYNEDWGSSKVTSSIYVVRFGGSSDELDVQGLANPGGLKPRQPVNMGEYVRDVVEMLAGIGVFGGKSVARLAGITDA